MGIRRWRTTALDRPEKASVVRVAKTKLNGLQG
jgi:hypothetical protein